MANTYRNLTTRINGSRNEARPVALVSGPSSISGRALSRPPGESLVWQTPAVLRNPFGESSHGANTATLRSLITELARVRDNERQKIGDELHDRVGQTLALVMMKLGALENAVTSEQAAVTREIRELISEVVDETRSLVGDLHPVVAQHLRFEDALDALIEQIHARYGLPCTVELLSLPHALEQDVQEVFFQAVRELLINVAKHAGATRAHVVVQFKKRSLLAQIVDDGKGFPPVRLSVPSPKPSGFGLLSIRERLANQGGHLRIDSAPGKGTRATITVPLKSAQVNAS